MLAEAQRPLPEDVAGFHDALLLAADAHDPIRMDHLVHGWAQARAELLPVADAAELTMQAVLDRRLGQVLFGAGHPAAAQVLEDALARRDGIRRRGRDAALPGRTGAGRGARRRPGRAGRRAGLRRAAAGAG